MRRALVLVALLIVAAALVPSRTSAYDRYPLKVKGLNPDNWGASISNAEAQLPGRYPGIKGDYCVGVIMIGHETTSSFIHGMTRYWDKLACAGGTTDGKTFGLIYDQKSASGWIIYRLIGANIADLR